MYKQWYIKSCIIKKSGDLIKLILIRKISDFLNLLQDNLLKIKAKTNQFIYYCSNLESNF